MLTGFLTFEQYHGKENIGSSRIRVDWLLDHWKEHGYGEAERFMQGRKYDCIVFQKVYWVEYAELFQGLKILDICDADWMIWSYEIKRMIEACDAVTCPTQAIADFIKNITRKPVFVIPDRINFDKMPKTTKQHTGRAEKVAWFGYSENAEVLDNAVIALQKRNLELIVISNRPYVRPSHAKKLEIVNFPWSPDTWVGDLLKADIVINPKSSNGRFRYKSDNKTVQSWALGLPVAHDDKELDALMEWETRSKVAAQLQEVARKDYDVILSVKEMSGLIENLLLRKKHHG